jgi:hypothetical protein
VNLEQRLLYVVFIVLASNHELRVKNSPAWNILDRGFLPDVCPTLTLLFTPFT